MSLSIKQEPKYDIKDGKHVNRATGIAIPDEEPIIIFRAKDLKSEHALLAYRDACNDVAHRAVIDRRIADFRVFAAANPGLMKEPDTAHPIVDMHPVMSSNVAEVGYHDETQTLAVKYKHGADIYHYLNVPPVVNEQRIKAASVGSFIASNVKPIFDSVKIPAPETAAA